MHIRILKYQGKNGDRATTTEDMYRAQLVTPTGVKDVSEGFTLQCRKYAIQAAEDWGHLLDLGDALYADESIETIRTALYRNGTPSDLPDMPELKNEAPALSALEDIKKEYENIAHIYPTVPTEGLRRAICKLDEAIKG